MGKIVVIGGGEIKDLETLNIDKHIINLTKRKHPKVLFIPTASGDSIKYWNNFQKIYGNKLGCKTDVLFLLNLRPTLKKIINKILSSDLIYVGGGNTLKMMKCWRFLGIDKILKEAYKRNIILSGLSAGGICWFEFGHSDSMSSYHTKKWNYIKTRGLGLIKGFHCPHFNSETKGKKRNKSFIKFMKRYSGMGIAVDNHCAIEFVNKFYRIFSTKKNSNTYRIYKKNRKIKIEKMEKNKWRSISSLYSF